jgi:hypothetical protein
MKARGIAIDYPRSSRQRAETTCDADALVSILVVCVLIRQRNRPIEQYWFRSA